MKIQVVIVTSCNNKPQHWFCLFFYVIFYDLEYFVKLIYHHLYRKEEKS